MKVTLTILILIFSTYCWGCQCGPLSRKDVRRIAKQANFVLVGIAIENVHYNDSVKLERNMRNYGRDVKFKVIKIIKGELKSNYVYLNQFESDCPISYKFGEQYVIVGTQIKEFENERPFSETDYNNHKIFDVILPPPRQIGGMTIAKMRCFNVEKELVDYWNSIVKNEIVLFTQQCSSFYATSRYGKYFSKKIRRHNSKLPASRVSALR